MSERLVMLDANFIIAAFDNKSNTDEVIRNEVLQELELLLSDITVRFVTTPFK